MKMKKFIRHYCVILFSILFLHNIVIAQSKITTPKPATPISIAKTPQTKVGMVGPTPGWVKDAVLTNEKKSEGTYYRLIDNQTLLEGSSKISYLRLLKEANDVPSLTTVGSISIVFDPSYEELTFHKIDIIRGGKKINALDTSKIKLIQRETNLEYQIYDGNVTASLGLEDLRVGDTLDLAYSIKGNNPAFGGKYVDTVWMVPADGAASQIRFRLLAPESRKINYKNSLNTQIESHSTGGLLETSFIRTLVPQWESDGRTPRDYFQRDQIHLSEFMDWKQIAAWGKELFGRGVSEHTDALKEVVSNIKAQSNLPEERLRLALDFVQKEIRYFGTEIGPYRYQPFHADKVLSQRFGDCKDKTELLINLLKEMGIDAEPVLASTNLRERVDGGFASPYLFNHAITKVLLNGKVYWLDGTRSLQSGAIEQRQSFGLGKVLVLGDNSTELVLIPGTGDREVFQVDDLISIANWQEAPKLTSVSTYYGENAESLRYALSNGSPDKVKLGLSAEIARAYPGIENSAETMIENDAINNSIRVTQTFLLPKFWKFPEQKLLIGEYMLWGTVSPIRFDNELSRKRPFEIAQKGIYRHSLRVNFPVDIVSKPVANQTHDENKQLDMATKWKFDVASYEIQATLRIKNSLVDANEWPSYTDFIRKKGINFSGSVRIPAMSQGEITRVSKKIQELKNAWDGFFTTDKPKTKTQSEARIKRVILSAQIDSRRLNPELLSQALHERAIQSDRLGLFQEAKLDLLEAMRLSPDNADILAGAAENAFYLGEDANAETYIRKSIELDSGKTYNHQQRARYRYFAGDYQEAKRESLEVLKISTDGRGGYEFIQLALTEKRLGGNVPKLLEAYYQSSISEWPHPILNDLISQKNSSDAITLSQKNEVDIYKACEAYYYAGESQLADGHIEEAKKYFKKAIDTGVVEFIEYNMAQRRLASM